MKTASPSLKVLHVAEVMQGGIATYLEQLMTHQLEVYGAGAVHLCCPETELQYLPSELLGKISVHAFEKKRRGVFAVFAMVKVLIRISRRDQPDVVHAHSSVAGGVARLPYVFSNAKRVYTPHSWAFSMPVGPIKVWMLIACERLLALNTDAIVAVSSSEAKLAEKHGIRPRSLHVIRSGICDVTPPKCAPKLEPVSGEPLLVRLIMVARFAAQKRHQDLIDALSRVEASNWKLSLVGDGELKSAIEAQVEALGLSEKIEFLGFRSDVPDLLARADVFVLISAYEGLPLSILEAMRSSLPVVASDVDGNGEAVLDGQTGYLIAPKDIAALSAKLAKLIGSEELREALGSAGRRRFLAEFTAEHMNNDICALYSQLKAS